VVSFLSTYAGVRFATGKKAPGVAWPLIKAAGLIVWMAILLPVALVQFIANNVRVSIPADPTPYTPPPKRPTTHRGYPRRFDDHIIDLTEDMYR
jgi:hypothetical protein